MDKKATLLRRFLAEGKPLSGDETDYVNENPTHRLVVAKQRHWEFEGTIPLWFSSNSLQFTGDNSGQVLPFNIGGEK